MIVCVCKCISDRQLRAEVRAGADTFREVSRRTGVATQCGRCGSCARAIVDDAIAEITVQTPLAGGMATA